MKTTGAFGSYLVIDRLAVLQAQLQPAHCPLGPARVDRRLVEGYVAHYNNVCLNSAIGYVTPKDMLAGRQQEILAQRDRKLEAARQQRQIRRQRAA